MNQKITIINSELFNHSEELDISQESDRIDNGGDYQEHYLQ
uniref:Uncharacterized protein n=1 Tax=Tetranychus urticae TaxID=32264 RepID=T1K8F8_TETUR